VLWTTWESKDELDGGFWRFDIKGLNVC
jgi:hypothetical protein